MSDAWANATPLRNADFKALLATPRPAHLQQQQKTPKQHYKKDRSADDGEKKQKFKKPPPKPRPGKPDEDKEKQEGPNYRDRAKERREGVNIDFVDPEQELAARGLAPNALQHLSIEQSKFLGGDIAHTHLVKGLDYALLHQERQKLEVDKSKEKESSAAVAAKAPGMVPRGVVSKEAMQFQTVQGRAVFDALFRPPPVNRVLVREMFQPRRTAFVFEFGEGAGDVPTTLRRSKADCPPVQDLVSAAADATVLERISKIVGYIQSTSKGGKRSERDSAYIRSILAGVNPAAAGDAQVHGQLVMKGQAAITAGKAAAGEPDGAAAAAAAGEPEEDDDIFGEAGTEYVPEIPKKKGAEGDARRPDGGCFADRSHVADMQQQQQAPAGGDANDVDMDIEEGEVPVSRAAAAGQQQQQQQQQHDAAQYNGYGQQYELQYEQQGWQQQQQYGQQQYDGQYNQYNQYGQYGQAAEEPKWRVRTKPGQELKGFDDDAYAECFPSMMDIGGAEDDDEPAKPEKPGTAGAAEAGAGAGAGAGRGGGRGAGRGGRGGGGGGVDDLERKLSQKLSKEVQQMQGLFKDKGWGNEGAFKKQEKLDAVAATPARKRIRL